MIETGDQLQAEKIWNQLQAERLAKAEKIPLASKEGSPFWYLVTPALLDLLTKIAQESGFLEGLSLPKVLALKMESTAINTEAYYSSHIEGAVSSLEEALAFIKKKQRFSPNESLQMIGNNQRALEYALSQTTKPITDELLWKLQEILTENTHKDRPITRGEYRHGPVYIVDGWGHVIYEGPPHAQVPLMMEKFIEWLNSSSPVNPMIKAAVAHFYFVHVHPFDDGNGRTARALANLVLANAGFKLINMVSISSYFDHKRPSYYKAIQDSRNHEGDLTYFIIFCLEALAAKIGEVKEELKIAGRVKGLKEKISSNLYQKLNRRQIKGLGLMIRSAEKMTTQKYCKINKCSDETARKDFLELMGHQMINSVGMGRSRGYQLSKAIAKD